MKIRSAARWTPAVAALAAVCVGAVLLRPAPAAPPPRSADANGFADWRGVSSCTSSACHGQAVGRDAGRGAEYAVWAESDPHARAFQVLFDPRSVGIQKRLNQADPSKKETMADRNLLCVRCHVAPQAERAVEAAPVWFGDGVGCESCHGPAGGWLAAHVGRAWSGMPQEEKEGRGFKDMKNLTERASACTACHVGGDRAEVNHDLLAAGHPPLLFEFSSALERYRPYQHWSEADDRRRNPSYEAEAWAVGQAASAEAALRLLAVRARGAKAAADPKPWPEFAEYDCSSCHHHLKPESPRSAAPTLGLPAWSWYVSLTPFLPEPPARGDQLHRLREEMEKRTPDPGLVAPRADELAGAYHEWLSRHAGSRVSADDLRRRLLRLTGPEGEEVAGGRWEDARNLSFAISAYYRSLEAVEPRGRDAQTGALVDWLAEKLRPPPGQDTPSRYHAEAVAGNLQDIHGRLKGR